MRYLILSFLLVFSTLAFSQGTSFSMEIGLSTRSELLSGAEFTFGNALLSGSVHGNVFVAKRGEDRSTRFVAGPRLYLNLIDNGSHFISPYVGATYQYGSDNNRTVASEVGGSFGVKLGLYYGREKEGIIYIRPNALISKQSLYSISLGLGGIF